MSSDDFSTVNLRRGERTREIEQLRQHYREHRDALMRLIQGAPSEHLATEYQRLVRDIDGSLAKLDELEGRSPSAAAAAIPPAGATRDSVLNQKTEPGTRIAPPPPPPPPAAYAPADETIPAAAARSGARTLFMIAAAVLVLAILGFLVWRAARDRRTERPVIAETETSATTTTAPPPVSPAPGTSTTATTSSAAALSVTPAIADYGTIRKGTRAVRQIEVTNTTSQPLTYSVARSQCRCLYYDYTGKLAAKKKETLTVTVDGAKAKAGQLVETIGITSKQNPAAKASFQVNAAIQ